MYIAMQDKGTRIKKIPEGDTRERDVCSDCGHIDYKNPVIVNTVVAAYGDEFLLCKRGNEPRKGYWTIPGGYMENGESPQDGAKREAHEEAGADIKIGPLLAMYQPPRKDEVIMIFRGELSSKEVVTTGLETLDVKFFKWEDIPWKELAFPFVKDALELYRKTRGKTDFQPVLIQAKPPQQPPKCSKPKALRM